MNASGKRYFIVCCSNRHDLLPTGYYNLNGIVVPSKVLAARFDELLDAVKFVEKHGIELGPECYIGFTVDLAP